MNRAVRIRIGVLLLIVISIAILVFSIDRIQFNTDWQSMAPENRFTDNYRTIGNSFSIPVLVTAMVQFNDSMDFEGIDSLAAIISSINGIKYIIKPFQFDTSGLIPPVKQYSITGSILNAVNKDKSSLLMHIIIKPGSDKYISETLASLDSVKSQYDNSNMKITVTGLPVIKQDENKAVQNRGIVLTGIALILILFLQFIAFRNIRYLIVMIVSVATATIWTLIFIAMTIKSLNMLTAMFIPVICGLGIDYLIHTFYSMNFREKNNDYREVFRPILLGVITTSLGFILIIFSGFRVFREFGMITAFGICSMFAAVRIIVPVFIKKRDMQKQTAKFGLCAHAITKDRKFRWVINIIITVIIIISITGIIKLRYSTDTDLVQNSEMESNKTALMIQEQFGYYPAPIVLMTDNVASESNRILDYLSDNEDISHVITSMDTLYTAYMLGNMKSLKPGIYANMFKTVTNSELMVPGNLNNYFINDSLRLFIIFPSESFWNSKRVEQFIHTMDEMTAERGTYSGVPLIMHQVGKSLTRNIFYLFLLTFASMIIIVSLSYRSKRLILIVLVYMVLTYSITFGMFSIFGFNLNFMNMLALPLIACIAIDDCIHFIHYLKKYGYNTESVLRNIMMPITLTSLTTIIGFGSLMFYLSRGVRELGVLFVTGFLVAYILIVFFIPAAVSSIYSE